MGNDERSRERESDADEAHTVRGGNFLAANRVASLSTQDLDSDSADEIDDDRDLALMRAVAFAPPRHPPSSVTPGTKWSASGRYVIERRLGRGGMGTVYAATDTVLNRIVALKVLDVAGADHDAAHHARLLREAQLAASMEHERIARVYDVGSHEGFAFVAMEYVPGGTLRQWMARGEVPATQAVDIATQIAEGLAELHAKGVVHRDLKPENVMMTAQGGVKLVDFGLARYAVLQADEPGEQAGSGRRVVDSASTAANSGTPGYMAPEQCGGLSMDERVDIFALGVILYELITREKPFRGSSVGAIVCATLEGAPIFDDAIWGALPSLLRCHTAKMLEREPDARFADGSRVLAALRELATGMSGERTRVPVPEAELMARAATERPVRRRGPVFVDVGLASRGLELPVAVTAFVILAVHFLRPSPAGAPAVPSGMAYVDVGTIDVGRTPFELERECHEMKKGCVREFLYRETPRVRVTVPAFLLDRDEVTNAEFAGLLNRYMSLVAVIADQDSHEPRFVRLNPSVGGDLLLDLHAAHGGIEFVAPWFRARAGHERLPVVQVTWYGAELYCSSSRKRLPTDNEWEAAARGREDRRFPWGNDLPRCGRVAIANDRWIPGTQDCGAATVVQPVGTMSQDVTPGGVRDLGGNVAEWTSSVFVEGNRGAQPKNAPRNAPRVFRGGAWDTSLMARTSGRDRLSPLIVGTNIGFRCAADVDDAQP